MIRLGVCFIKMAAQFSPIGRSPCRHSALFQMSDHLLPQGRIVINNSDMTYICQHCRSLELAATNRDEDPGLNTKSVGYSVDEVGPLIAGNLFD